MESHSLFMCMRAKSRLAATVVFVALTPLLRAQDSGREDVDPVAIEEAIIAAAKDAATKEDWASAEAALLRPADRRMRGGESATFARRSMAVCSRLRNQNDWARSRLLAERVLARLERLTEKDDEERVERLYWESCLLTGILDRHDEALALLNEAEELAPADERILQSSAQLSDAVAQAGRAILD